MARKRDETEAGASIAAHHEKMTTFVRDTAEETRRIDPRALKVSARRSGNDSIITVIVDVYIARLIKRRAGAIEFYRFTPCYPISRPRLSPLLIA